MAKGNAIAAAVLASSGNSSAAGASLAVPGGLSPLVASYQQLYSVNRPYSPLPRDPKVFLNGAFGPMDPITPMPIDPPREDSGRPDPRRYVYRIGHNLPTGVPGEEDKLVPFSVLRSVADKFSVVRACVEKRKSEIVGLEWDVIPTPEAEHAMADDEKARSEWEKRRAKVVEFFSHPDSDRAKYPTFGSWLNAILEDRFVVDAVALHLVPPRKKGGGPFGSDLAAINILDSTTIRPLISTMGSTPPIPSPAYEQYIYGVPRVDMISVINGDDLQGLGEPVADFRADQLIYLRETTRTFTMYGFSCVEKAYLPIQIGLARQEWQSDYFTDGSVPAQWITPGPDISTPQQIRQLQEALNQMAGDIGAKHRIIVLPPGSKADPQKPIALADQTDEWLVALVTMPFGLTPLDLGVTPRVSAIQSPGQSQELSNVNSDKGSQTRIEPVCNDLKAVIFDFVVQELFKQRDMEWSWGITDRGKNRAAAIQEHVQLIDAGVESIDEARMDLGKPPWGLPETSVPMVVTQMGPVPLSAVAGDTQVQPAQPGQPSQPSQKPQPAVPAKKPQQALPPKQPQDSEMTTPAHEAARDLPATPAESKASAPRQDAAKQAAELEILGRFLRKGRDPLKFRADHLPAEALEAAAKALPAGAHAALEAARRAAEAKRRQEKRDEKVAVVAALVTARLGKLVAAYQREKMSSPDVIDRAVEAMTDGYEETMTAGSADASADYPDTPPQEPQAIQAQAQAAGEGQRGYFMGLLQDIIGGLSVAMTRARLGLFAATLRREYNRAYGETAMNAHPDAYLVWELGSNEFHCGPCLGRAGKKFTLDTLPGWPGDGGFGNGGIGGGGTGLNGAAAQENICAGGPNCHCSVSLVRNGRVVSTGTNTQQPGAQDYYARQRAKITARRQEAQQAREEFLSNIPSGPAIRAQTRDALRRQVADLANARIRAAGGYQGVSVEPQDVPAKIIAQMLPPDMAGAAGASTPRLDVAAAVDAMFAKRLSAMDMTRDELTAIVKGVIADLEAAGVSAPPVDASVVYDQLSRNYRPEGIGWVRDLQWVKVSGVPLDDIDWEHLDTWAAAHDHHHVDRFEHKIRAGHEPHPVVMVQVPGSRTLKVIDGHHRSLARKRLGQPVPAYVGLADSDAATAPWFRTWHYQVHSGGDPLNKGADDPDRDESRVAFLLVRAPNEHGKMRYLLQLRRDGSWGLPGGHCDLGEGTWDAAVREAREELGTLPDVQPSAVWTRAGDGHVVWTYLVDLPEMFAPPGEEGGLDETAGQGWFRRKDVEDLDLHPAMRETWEGLDFGKADLGGKAPEAAAKEARGYELKPLSCMISLDVPDGLIEPVPGGVDDFHITVCYCGPDVRDDALAEICRRAGAAAGAVPGPLSGVISGRGTFPPSGSSDGKTPVWAGVTLPGAEALREAVADLSASEHLEWHPHVTRVYADLEAGDALPDPLPAVPVTFTHLSVHRADGKVFRYPLGGG